MAIYIPFIIYNIMVSGFFIVVFLVFMLVSSELLVFIYHFAKF